MEELLMKCLLEMQDFLLPADEQLVEPTEDDKEFCRLLAAKLLEKGVQLPN